ncbi:hypothetical protein Efla_007424 [Eimeria flavescens]
MALPPLSAASPLSNSGAGIIAGVLIVVAFHVSLFVGAHYFLTTHLYRDYEVQKLSVQRLFCATFTACVSMLQLLLLELLHILNPLVRRVVWNVDLICVLLLLYVILPVSIIHNVLAPDEDSFRIADIAARFPQMRGLNARAAAFSRLTAASGGAPFGGWKGGGGGVISRLSRLSPRFREWAIVAACSALVLPLLWYCFNQSGRLLHLDADSLAVLSYTERLLAYVGVCGVTVVSALAGIGSVNYPYRNVAAFLHPTTQAEVACVEQRLLHTLNLVSEKKKTRLQLQASLNPVRSTHWPTPTLGVLPPLAAAAAGPPAAAAAAAAAAAGDAAACRRGRSASRRRYGSGLAAADSAATAAATTAAAAAARRGLSGGAGRNACMQGDFEAWSTAAAAASAAEPQQAGRLPGLAGEEKKENLFSLPFHKVKEWIARGKAFVTGKTVEQQCQRLQSEIEALEELSRELFVGLDDLVHSRAQAVYGQTLLGRMNNLFGWLMTFVCIYRVCLSAANVLLGRVSLTDPATRTLELLFHLLKAPIDVKLLTPYLSLILMGWIIALTIRGFFEKLLTAVRYMSTAVSSNVLALIMSEVMGIYFSACLLLTRMYLPQAYRDALAQNEAAYRLTICWSERGT